MSGAPVGFARFRGLKEIFAQPMTRLAYNEYRGWELPADENGEDEGFLVEYIDGGKANHPKHMGYISWSPADVFARAYTPVVETTFVERMRAELNELNDRLTRLQIFIGTERFNDLPTEERCDQRTQLVAMQDYSVVLTKRLVRASA